jgi:uncharacterized protein
MKHILFIILLATTPKVFALTNDPFADKKLTCREMRVYPQQIFSGNIYLGLLNVDYECKESLISLSFLKHLDKLTEYIHGDNYYAPCGGSLMLERLRDYHFALLLAGFAPEMLLDKEYKIRPYQKNNFNFWVNYFKFWAYQSPSNFRLYRAFYTEYKKALPLLTRHYQKHFAFSPKKAQLIANTALTFFINRAAGASSNNSWNDDKFTKIDQTLKAALLHHQSKQVIALLASQLKPIDNGDESALFFALHNKKYIQLLLNKGAAIDYANGFGKTALFYAIENNTHGIVKYLLQKGANPNHSYKSKEELKNLDFCIYNIQHSKRTPLMHAAQHIAP